MNTANYWRDRLGAIDAANRDEWEAGIYTAQAIGYEAAEDVFTLLRQGYYGVARSRLLQYQNDAWAKEHARRLIEEAAREAA